MVRIKSITIQNFKSFGNKRTIIKLPPGLIVITGPNGGGKSTVLDAVKFALGELSAHNLRADRFSKLLHESSGGQEQHASVSLTLDNSGRTIPVDSADVVLTRKLSLTGESEYLVNGKIVSRNEMLTLLSAANIKPDGLNLVAQGSVVGIAEMTSKELRQVLEDAAGISGYKKKRDDAFKELEMAQKNIEIAKAATSEVRNRVKQLELERNQYLRKTLVEKEINRLKYVTLLNEIKNIRQTLLYLEERASEVIKNLSEKQTQIAEIDEKISNARKEVETLQQLREQVIKKLWTFEKQIIDKESEKSRKEAEIRSHEKSVQQLLVQHSLLKERIQGWRDRLAVLEAKLVEKADECETAHQAYLEAEERLTSHRTVLEELMKRLEELEETYSSKLDEVRYLKLSDDGRSLLLENIEKQIDKTMREREELLKQIETLQTKAGELAEGLDKCRKSVDELSIMVFEGEQKISAQKEKIDLINSKISEVNKVIEEIKLLKSNISNLAASIAKRTTKSGYSAVETLGDRLSDKLSPAFKAVLGDWVNALLVDDLENAINLAKQSAELGVPLKIIPLSHFNLELENLIKNITGMNLPQILESAKQLKPTDKNVATQDGVYIAQNHTINIIGDYDNSLLAIQMEKNLKKLDELERISLKALSTLEFKVAARKKYLQQLLSESETTKKQLEEKRLENTRLETSLQNIHNVLENLKNRLDSVEKNLAGLEAERDKLMMAVAEKRDELAALSELKAGIEKLRLEVRYVEENLRQNSVNVSNLYRAYLNLEREKDALTLECKNISEHMENAEKEIAGIEDSVGELGVKIESLKKEKAHIEEELASLRKRKNEAEEEQTSLDQKLTEKTKELKEFESLIHRLNEEATVLEKENNNIIVERVRMETSLQALNERLQTLSIASDDSDVTIPAELLPLLEDESKTIPVVNQLAVMQYDGIASNYKVRATRINELELERKRILDFIESINKEEIDAFGKALEKVSDSFNFYFNQLTGGEGFLRLENPQDPLNSGVEIVVKFVGKPARTTSYVSGGEKSVSAVALILALQDLTPAQFYIFDEIDAHLDAVYIKNLVNLLKRMSAKKQIIIITLKDIIAEQADALFGVYMVDEASQIVKTRLDEVVEAG